MCAGFYVNMFSTPLGKYQVRSQGENTFSFVRNFWTLFQRGSTVLLFHQQWNESVCFLHSCQHLVVSVFWILASLVHAPCYLTVVLICKSLKDILHWASFRMLTGHLGIPFCICWDLLPIFKWDCLFSYSWVVVLIHGMFWIQVLFHGHEFCKDFLQPCDLSFHSLNSIFVLFCFVFVEWKFLLWVESKLLNFFFHGSCFWYCIYELIAKPSA